MSNIGSPSLFIGGQDWYIGSWYTEGALSNSTYLGLREEDQWIFRNENGEVITELDFGVVAPAESYGTEISMQYRGFNPIKISGFYLKDVSRDFYLGSKSPLIDKGLLLEWADKFTGAAVPPGVPGLELSQTHWETAVVSTTQFKGGEGDTEFSPITYVGHEKGILKRDDRLIVNLRITPPSDISKEILESSKIHIALELSFEELPANLISFLADEDG